MKIFKITFEIKDPTQPNEWSDGFYFVEDSIVEVQKYLTELYEQYEVKDLMVLTADIPGWRDVPVRRESEMNS